MNNPFVPTAEAAFIADIPDRDINRAVDEHILPDSLVRNDNGRQFARLGAALAGFYFRSDDVYSAALRRRVVVDAVGMLRTRQDREMALCLDATIVRLIDWRIAVQSALAGVVLVDVGVFVFGALERVRTLKRAEELVISDPEILGGLPVFAGTRVPIDSVLSSLRKGVDRKRVFDAYPNLTDEHLEAADLYANVRPRRGRPVKSSMPSPTWNLKRTSRALRHA